MSAQEYIANAFTDLENLNLFTSHTPDPSAIEAADIFLALQATKEIGDQVPPCRFKALTSFGSLVGRAVQSQVSFNTHAAAEHYEVCSEAEMLLRRSVSPRQDGYNDKPPIVVTHHGNPVGLIKGAGEKTTYVLHSLPKLGLVKRTFSLPDIQVTPTVLPEDAQAFSVEAAALGTFRPLRFAITAIPLTVRADIHPGYFGRSVRLSHHAVVRQTHLLHRLARPLVGRALERALADTRDYYGT